jgi:competence protein ComFB
MLDERPINLAKIIAEELLQSVMLKMDVPDTEENRVDILALALNKLPAKYVTTDEGKQYSKLVDVYKTQYELDVITSLTKASIQILQKPRGTSGGNGGNRGEQN